MLLLWAIHPHISSDSDRLSPGSWQIIENRSLHLSDFCFNNAVQQAPPIAQQCSVNRASSAVEHRLLSSVAGGSHSGTSDYLENPASIASGRCTRELGGKI